MNNQLTHSHTHTTTSTARRPLLGAALCATLALAGTPVQIAATAPPAAYESPGYITLTSTDGRIANGDTGFNILPNCYDGNDDDKDGKVDMADPDCVATNDSKESESGNNEPWSPVKLTGRFYVSTNRLEITSVYFPPVYADEERVKLTFTTSVSDSKPAVGTFNWANGSMTLSLPVVVQATSPYHELGSECKFGVNPTMALKLTTGTSGQKTGTPFPAGQQLSGSLKLVDNTLVVPEPTSISCGGLANNTLVKGALPTGSQAVYTWADFRVAVTAPATSGQLTEVESGNTSGTATVAPSGVTPSTVAGSLRDSADADYYKFDLPAGKKQLDFEHTFTVTTTETYECANDALTTDGPRYSSPPLVINNYSTYTSNTVSSVEGLCWTGSSERRRRQRQLSRPVNPPTTAYEVFTTVTTYKLKTGYATASGSSTVTLGVSRNKNSSMSSFPPSGSYKISVTVP